MKYVIIRDDDVNFFTKIENLNKVYSFIFERNIPINFAIIPNVDASAKTFSDHSSDNIYEPFIPKEFRGQEKQFPINENKELIKDLRSLRNAEFLLHGFTHKSEVGNFEFEIEEESVINEKLNRGSKILELAFEKKSKTFVAPQDKYSEKAFLALQKSFDTFSLGWIDKAKIPKSFLIKYYLMKLRNNNYIFKDNFLVLQHPGCQFSKFKEIKKSSLILDKYLFSHKIAVLVVHNWEFFNGKNLNQELYTAFKNRILSLWENEDFKFINFSELNKIICK
ncbi:MAG: DUF2334 domain-containing protein [Armatimonadetes bacterium]|nr:DUF2334 domain-containing protein [Armatimonadota bacterium]